MFQVEVEIDRLSRSILIRVDRTSGRAGRGDVHRVVGQGLLHERYKGHAARRKIRLRPGGAYSLLPGPGLLEQHLAGRSRTPRGLRRAPGLLFEYARVPATPLSGLNSVSEFMGQEPASGRRVRPIGAAVKGDLTSHGDRLCPGCTGNGRAGRPGVEPDVRQVIAEFRAHLGPQSGRDRFTSLLRQELHTPVAQLTLQAACGRGQQMEIDRVPGRRLDHECGRLFRRHFVRTPGRIFLRSLCLSLL